MVESRMEVEEGEDVEAERVLYDRMRREEEMEERITRDLSSDGNHNRQHRSKHKEKSGGSERHRSKESKRERRGERERGSEDKERAGVHYEARGKDRDSHYHDSREKDVASNKDRRREDREDYRKERERDRDNGKEKVRERDYDYDRPREKEREREKDRNRERDVKKESGRERERDKDRDKYRNVKKETGREREREKEREKDRERDRGRDGDSERIKHIDRDLNKERLREKDFEREKDKEMDGERSRDRERGKDWEKVKDKDKDFERGRDRERMLEFEHDKLVGEKNKEKTKDKDSGKVSVEEREQDRRDRNIRGKVSDKEMQISKADGTESNKADNDNDDGGYDKGSERHHHVEADLSNRTLTSSKELEDRILKMREERMKNTDGVSEAAAWVARSRMLEEKKHSERRKARQRAKVLEEQDMIGQEESDDERVSVHSSKDLAGVKILHGLDKVLEGGAVVLTLKDQNILANGDINEEADMLVNVEIEEQKQRNEAYKAAKKIGIYDDKFDDDGSQKNMLPQYDDVVQDEGVTIDESGRFTAEAEKKLEELRKRLQGSVTNNKAEDLTAPGKVSSDYYTHEEMLQFKKPKKKKSLRKKEKLDLDAMEAEAISAGLGTADLGRRDDVGRQSAKDEKERLEAEMRKNAYQLAAAKAEEASNALRMRQTVTINSEEDPVFGDDDDLYKSIEEARRLALKKQEATAGSGVQVIAALATSNYPMITDQTDADHEGKMVFTEMDDFLSKLNYNDEMERAEPKDTFVEKTVSSEFFEDMEVVPEGLTYVEENAKGESIMNEETEDTALDTTILEPTVGKGLSGVLQLLQQRGTLKEGVDWGGRNMDKKKSKLVGIADNNNGTKEKEIRIERTDEFGRILTPKEAFRIISHKFHGKGPGKMKQEKRMKQYQEDLKLKQMKASDTPLMSTEKMREAQARSQCPYIVLSGNVKSGQSSDPRSAFAATIEKEQPGSLTPMLGDKKVEAFLGIKRKAEPSNLSPSKKPKT